ncbi:MAG: Gldg family protein [Deltaproteobacteria bacterium]|nr:Gldg family protein [Deltaproteobacteria bacterium]
MSANQKTTGLFPSALLALSLIILLVGERVFGEGTARQALSFAGVLVFVLSLGLRIRGLLRSDSEMRKAETLLLTANGGVALALLLYAFSGESALELFAVVDDAADSAQTVLLLGWTCLLAVSLCALLFMELVYNRMPLAESVELRRVKTALYAGLTLGFALIFLFCVNYVAKERDIRRDVSYFRTTQPSDGTLRLVRRLDRPVRIILFYRRSDDVLNQIKPYFSLLGKASKHIKLDVIDYAMAPELTRKNRIRDNGYVLLLRGEGEEEKGESFEIGLELTGARGKLKTLDALFQQHFRKLNRPKYSLQLTVGHGERNSDVDESTPGELTKGMETLLKRLNIRVSNLGVAQGLSSAVPDEASAVAIIGPREKFMREEAETLLSYVQNGGRLLLMLDSDMDVGLEPLLKGLDIQLLPGVVTSEKHFVRSRSQQSDQTVVYTNNYSSHPIVTTVNRHRSEVASVFARGAAVARRADSNLSIKPKVTFPVRTASDFWRDLDGDFAREQGEEKQSLNLVAAVTLARENKPEGRVVIIGDGDFVTDKLISNSGNSLVFVDTLAWLIADEQIAGDVTSEEDVPIEHTRDQDKIWFYTTSFAVPLPILCIGIWIARRRRRRQEARA